MMIAPPASHAPFTAAPRHKHSFSGVRALRTPSFNYSSFDVSDLLFIQQTCQKVLF